MISIDFCPNCSGMAADAADRNPKLDLRDVPVSAPVLRVREIVRGHAEEQSPSDIFRICDLWVLEAC